MRDLVVRAQRGDRDAFAALVQLASDRMYALAARILRDNDLAEDALQGAFINAWRQLPTLRIQIASTPGSARCWSTPATPRPGVAGRGRPMSESCRSTGRRVRMTSSPSIERDALDRAFRRLTIEQRAVFVLHHHQGLPLVEIAETLGIPAGTARSRLHYATRVLRAAIVADDRTDVAHEGRMA